MGGRVYLVQVLFRASGFTGKNARDARLSEAARTREKIRVPDLLCLQLFLKRPRYLFLADKLSEGLRPVRAIERLMSHAREVSRVEIRGLRFESARSRPPRVRWRIRFP